MRIIKRGNGKAITTLISIVLLSIVIMFRYMLGDVDNVFIALFVLLFIYGRKIHVSLDVCDRFWIMYLLLKLFIGLLRETDIGHLLKLLGLLFIFLFIKVLMKNDLPQWSICLRKCLMFFGVIHCFAILLETVNPSLEHRINDFIGVTTKIDVTVWSFSINKGGITGEAGSAGFCAALYSCLIVNEVIRTKGMKKNINIIFSLVGLLSLLLTGKRALFWGTIISISFVIGFYNIIVMRKRSKNILIASCALLIISLISNIPSLSSNFSRLRSFGLSGREPIWSAAINNFRENPLFGMGAEKLRSEIMHIVGYSLEAHSDYLKVLAEDGLVGVVLFLCAISSPLIIMIKYLKENHMKMKEVVANDYERREYVYDIMLSISWQIIIMIYAFTGDPLFAKDQSLSYFVFLAIGFGGVNCLKHNIYYDNYRVHFEQ